MSKLKKFYNWATTDTNPEMTRFITKFIMPPAILFFACFSIYFYQLYSSELNDFKKQEIKIKEVILKKRSNNKPQETIYTDLLIYPKNSEINFTYSNLSGEQELLLNDLIIDDSLTIYNESSEAKIYSPNFYPIVHLERNNAVLISFDEVKNNWKKMFLTCGIFALLFLIWYLSRMYRYKKYGFI